MTMSALPVLRPSASKLPDSSVVTSTLRPPSSMVTLMPVRMAPLSDAQTRPFNAPGNPCKSLSQLQAPKLRVESVREKTARRDLRTQHPFEIARTVPPQCQEKEADLSETASVKVLIAPC